MSLPRTIELVFFVGQLGIIAWIAGIFLRRGPFTPRRLFAALVLAALFPLILLINLRAIIPYEYIDHTQLIALTAQEIRDGHPLPNVVHSANVIGDPTISMSGRIYYLGAGYLSLLFGSGIVTRILVYAVSLLQIVLMFVAANAYSRNRLYAFTIAALSCWSTYAMNNLNVRGALPEFMATSLIACAASCLLLYFQAGRGRLSLALGGALCLAAAALTHSITAVYGTLLMAVLAAVLAMVRPPSLRELLHGIGAACLVGLMLASWLFIVSVINPTEGALAISFNLRRLGGVDEAWVRLLPLPFSAIDPKFGHSYFVTPINSILLGLCLAVLVLGRAGSPRALAAAAVLLVAAALTLLVSVSGVFDAALPLALRAAQFAYRLVTYVNLLIFAAAVLAGLGLHRYEASRGLRIACLAVLAVAAVGVVVNLVQMGKGVRFKAYWPAEYQVLRPMPSREAVRNIGLLVGCSYARISTPVSPLACPTEKIGVRLRPDASGAVSARLDHTAGGRVQITNALNFPWNRLLVDDREATIIPSMWFYEVDVPARARTIRYVFDPGRTFVLLDRISLLTMALVLAAVVAFAVRRRRGFLE